MKVLAQNRTRAFDKKAVVKCAAAVALLIAASKVSFAIGPVPLTMQTFAVAVVGAWLGTRQGVAAVVRSEERRVGKECRARWALYR
mgnify:CR=1 FL=1